MKIFFKEDVCVELKRAFGVGFPQTFEGDSVEEMEGEA